jgi:hypothetical protein
MVKAFGREESEAQQIFVEVATYRFYVEVAELAIDPARPRLHTRSCG